MTFILGLLLGILLFAPKDAKPKIDNQALDIFKQVANIMTRQATHAQRLRLLYNKMPDYNFRMFQAMMTCEQYMQPQAKAYMAALLNEYNALVNDIADTMEQFKNDSIEIERLFVEV